MNNRPIESLKKQLGQEYFDNYLKFPLQSCQNAVENEQYYEMLQKRISEISTGFGILIAGLVYNGDLSPMGATLLGTGILSANILSYKFTNTELKWHHQTYLDDFALVERRVSEQFRLLLAATLEELNIPKPSSSAEPIGKVQEVVKMTIKETLEKAIPFLASMLP